MRHLGVDRNQQELSLMLFSKILGGKKCCSVREECDVIKQPGSRNSFHGYSYKQVAMYSWKLVSLSSNLAERTAWGCLSKRNTIVAPKLVELGVEAQVVRCIREAFLPKVTFAPC